VAQNSTGLLRISLTEGLVERLDKLIESSIGACIKEAGLNEIKNYSSLGLLVIFLLGLMMNFKFFDFIISEIDCH
jgi:hypothetical protein